MGLLLALLLPLTPSLLPLPLLLDQPDNARGCAGGVRGLLLLLAVLPGWLATAALGLVLLAPALRDLRDTGGIVPAGLLLPRCDAPPVMLLQCLNAT